MKIRSPRRLIHRPDPDLSDGGTVPEGWVRRVCLQFFVCLFIIYFWPCWAFITLQAFLQSGLQSTGWL